MTGFPDHPSLFTHAFQEAHYINSSLVMDEEEKKAEAEGTGAEIVPDDS